VAGVSYYTCITADGSPTPLDVGLAQRWVAAPHTFMDGAADCFSHRFLAATDAGIPSDDDMTALEPVYRASSDGLRRDV